MLKYTIKRLFQSMVTVLLVISAVFLLLPPIALKMIGFMYVILGVSGPVYACSHILRDLFDRVAAAAEKTSEPNN